MTKNKEVTNRIKYILQDYKAEYYSLSQATEKISKYLPLLIDPPR